MKKGLELQLSSQASMRPWVQSQEPPPPEKNKETVKTKRKKVYHLKHQYLFFP